MIFTEEDKLYHETNNTVMELVNIEDRHVKYVI